MQLHPDSQVLFVGAAGRMEESLVPREGFPLETVEITNISRSLSLDGLRHNLNTVKNVLTATSAAKKIIEEFEPDVAIGTGGYVCYPVLRAAHAKGIPTLIHESNAEPGLTTKMLSRTADKILVGLEESRSLYPKPERVEVTGTPVRAGFGAANKLQARAALGLDGGKSLVVSVWGSLGSQFMNDTMADLIEIAAATEPFSLIHSAGRGGYAAFAKKLAGRGLTDLLSRGFDVREYIYDMAPVCSAADIVVCRAGASTLAELAALGKPAVLIPSPNVTNNHQEKNARVFEKAGAAIVIPETAVTASSLLGKIDSLLSKPERLESMGRQMKKMGALDATGNIAETAMKLASRKNHKNGSNA
jgi:UDP-N-acetylglucosamine--N-acetylmuramyl-(pentapeptide) pyrophosphoryl-undecaprenol N-acetylglucosamine transferase